MIRKRKEIVIVRQKHPVFIATKLQYLVIGEAEFKCVLNTIDLLLRVNAEESHHRISGRV